MTAPSDLQSFEIGGPLPDRLALLEASAGTGKTFTIAALTTRYVAEQGLPIDRLLVITFTRMATGELRERVRERLVSAFDGLVDVLGGVERERDDEIVRILSDAGRPEREARRDRLARAIADFDAATIETTHGFCLQVLYGLGTAGDVDREVTLVEDVRDLLEEVVDDLYLRKFAHRPNELGFSRVEALRIARTVMDHPDAIVVPALSDADDPQSTRRRFARAVHEEMDRRKRALKILTYDDVLIRLRDTLRDPARGPLARARLRERYDVVLVDEFQDTDPVQWEIMHGAFGGEGTTLVLIGDPKQAIYAFRGADVQTYLKAKESVKSEWTLDMNWRSDAGLLGAYDALFAGAQLGQAGISYRNVHAARANVEPRLVGAPVAAPLRVRIVHGKDHLVARTNQGQLKAGDAREFIARDLAALTVEYLSAKPGVEVIRRRRDGTQVERPALHPGDVAVLVRSNKHAVTVRDALQAAGVPAVIGGSGSVFVSDAAREWLRLIEALERPASRARASLVALTQFIGWSAEEMAQAEEGRWEDLHWSLHDWARCLRDQGVASVYETISSQRALPARVLSRPDGERFMTDLRHVNQLLHEAGVTEGTGPTALANWLSRRIVEADRETENEERTRRLESDATAVQVITIHRSKGLEFPIVLCPYAWDGYIHTVDVPVFHDPLNAEERTIDVGCPGPDLTAHRKLEEVEEQGEALRLLYVALTRAQHQTVIWWAGSRDTKNSPLSRLVFGRGPDGEVLPHGKKTQPDTAVEEAFAALGPEVSVEHVTPPSADRWEPDGGRAVELEAALFDRVLDLGWRRVSYTGITRALHGPPAIGGEPEEPLTSDEEMPVPSWNPVGSGPEEAALRSVAVGLADMPGGALTGTIVHRALERIDFVAPDLAAAVARALEDEVAWRNGDLGDRDAVVAGLCAAIESSLGPDVDEVRLRDIARGDRLDELGFEIPLVGGEVPTAALHVSDLADLLEAHLTPGDPVRDYAGQLRDPALDGVLRGYLNGSLDLVFRLPGDRFVLADYKTNRLAAPDETLSAWHYRPEAVRAEMAEVHYPLQALIYSVALHRYLRWRLPGYDAARNLGGVLYLFLRGMSALEPTRIGGHPCGVWSWRPPPGLVESLSDLFDEGAGT
jgi:exodeoxyribonuclease V beta subunit